MSARMVDGRKSISKNKTQKINYLVSHGAEEIILGCTELPIAIFAFKSFQKIKKSKTFLGPNLILATSSMKKYIKR